MMEREEHAAETRAAEARLRRLERPWVRIGVTGHRHIADVDRARAGVDRALDRVQRLASHPSRPVPAFEVVSPLAEGADRLVVRQALERPGTRLIVPLPFAKDDYVTDFLEGPSRSEFEDLLARAGEVVTMPAAPSRAAGYAAAGRYVVDRCDVLLALWDGRPTQGHGGTAEIVAHAVEKGKLVLWIETSRHPGSVAAGDNESDRHR